MAERLNELEQRITAVEGLHEIVGAMRGVAAMRLQQAMKSLEGVRRYATNMSEALGMAVAAAGLPPPPQSVSGSKAVLVLAPEHGFSGLLAHRLMEAAAEEAAAGGRLYVAGSRALLITDEMKLPVAWSIPMATQIGGAAETARRISAELHGRFFAGSIASVQMVFASYQGGGHTGIAQHRLLPVNVEAHWTDEMASPPLTNMPPLDLLPRLVEEFFYAELMHGIVETIAAENGTRLVTMQSAWRSVDEKLVDLRRQVSGLRQAQITTEIIEVAAVSR